MLKKHAAHPLLLPIEAQLITKHQLHKNKSMGTCLYLGSPCLGSNPIKRLKPEAVVIYCALFADSASKKS